MKDSKPATAAYQNNPFFIGVDGIGLLFRRALQVAIFMIVLMTLSFMADLATSVGDLVNELNNPMTQAEQDAAARRDWEAFVQTVQSYDATDWIGIVGIIGLVIAGFIVIGVFIMGISDYTAAQLAKEKEVTLKQAALAVFRQLPGYLGLQVLVFLKVLGWTLLFVVPGIIMAVRYSLAGVAYFDQKKGAVKAIQRSVHLTENAWLTTFASFSLFNMITFGMIQGLLWPGITGILYRQYSAFDKAKLAKPEAHLLSWLTLIIPISLAVIAGILVAVAIFTVVTFYSSAQ